MRVLLKSPGYPREGCVWSHNERANVAAVGRVAHKSLDGCCCGVCFDGSSFGVERAESTGAQMGGAEAVDEKREKRMECRDRRRGRKQESRSSWWICSIMLQVREVH